LLYLIYKVYQIGVSAAISLSLLSLGPERKVKSYNGYFVNGYVFHTEEYRHGRKAYNSGVCIKAPSSSSSEEDISLGADHGDVSVPPCDAASSSAVSQRKSGVPSQRGQFTRKY